VTIGLLPANPKPIPLSASFSYQQSTQVADNMGLEATTVGNEVYYSASPFENATGTTVSLLNTAVSGNTGLSSSGTSTIQYSIEPISDVVASLASSTTGSIIITQRALFTNATVPTATLNQDTITGIYFKPGGYGSWADMDGETSTAYPWVTDPDAFLSDNGQLVYLVNSRGDPVYLCDPTGQLVKSSGSAVPCFAPKYATFQALLTDAGRLIENGVITNSTNNPILAIAQDGTNFTLSAPIDWPDATATSMEVRICLMTTASVTPNALTLNDTRLIHQLTQAEMQAYTPDRVCYSDSTSDVNFQSAFPSESDRPDLYTSGSFQNANGNLIYLANASGLLLTSSGAIATDMTQLVTTVQPLYKLCQDWFKADFFLAGYEDNPYWQYLVIRDVLDPTSHEWSTQAQVFRKVKSAAGTQMLLTPVAQPYVIPMQGWGYELQGNSFLPTQLEYFQYFEGQLSMILAANAAYDKSAQPTVDVSNRQYGISFSSQFDSFKDPVTAQQVSIFDTTHTCRAGFPSFLTADYTVNSKRNFASNGDNTSSIVSITEVGVFNQANQMIAYGTFPPIIYDSARHHLSLNLFIKKGLFSPLSS
jgi:hypothetical protein